MRIGPALSNAMCSPHDDATHDAASHHDAAAALPHAIERLAVDLSAVMSQYIGETEKNLAHLFGAAAHAGAALAFDEADALFGRRTDVRDAHDRYATLARDDPPQ